MIHQRLDLAELILHDAQILVHQIVKVVVEHAAVGHGQRLAVGKGILQLLDGLQTLAEVEGVGQAGGVERAAAHEGVADVADVVRGDVADVVHGVAGGVEHPEAHALNSVSVSSGRMT